MFEQDITQLDNINNVNIVIFLNMFLSNATRF